MLKEVMDKSLRPMFRLRVLVMLLCTIDVLVGLFVPFLIGRLVDNLDNYEIALRIGMLLIVVVIAQFFFSWVQNYYWFKMVHKGTALVRSDIFEAVLGKPDSFFTKNNSGDLINRILNDSNMYAQNRLISMPMLFLNVLRIGGVFVFLLIASPVLSAMVALLSLVYFLLYSKLNMQLRFFNKKERESYSKVMDSGVETLGGVQTIHLFGGNFYFAKRFNGFINKHADFLIKLQLRKSLGQSGASLLLNLMSVCSLLLGVVLIFRGNMTLGGVVSFYTYIGYLSEPIQNLTDYNLGNQQAKAVAGRLEELVTREEVPESTLELDAIKDITLDNVSFSYDDEKSIINNLSFTLVCGERLAVTGLSGSGKSTLIKLILGQLFAQQGRVAVNGNNLKGYDYQSYLSRIAVVPQDVFLFDGSLEENIAFGREIEENAVKESRTTACLEAIPLEESVEGFSGGERQRTGLARALLCDVDILILDEPTAALDMDTEKRVVSNISSYLNKNSNVIMITISHREEILHLCNKFLELSPNGGWKLK